MQHIAPIVGLVGGIAAGKSHVASVLKTLGCVVIDSDALSREAWNDPAVRTALQQVLGDDTDLADRSAVAKKLFTSLKLKHEVEAIIHPYVAGRRAAIMREAEAERPIFVWDSPLLIETGLAEQCDVVLLVDTPLHVRQARARARGWDEKELARREATQMTVEEKRARATDVVDGLASEQTLIAQLRPIVEGLR